jgi:hypothetical protein
MRGVLATVSKKVYFKVASAIVSGDAYALH